MKERILQFIWNHRRFNFSELKTTTGERVVILDSGKHNLHSGPDFLEARIEIGGLLWAGNIEIHFKSADWYKHHHQEDPVYENVILHVVWEDNRQVYHRSGKEIPCLELKPYVEPKLMNKFYRLEHTIDWIPCQGFLKDVPLEIRREWLDELSVKRLEDRSEKILDKLEEKNGDWETVFYEVFSRNLGLHINGDAFETLAERAPLRILSKHRDQLFQIEALLFGQAGLLSDSIKEDYPRRLLKEYEYLAKKYGLQPMSGQVWKFMRLRPINFPTIRIAQLAKVIHQSEHLFSKAISLQSLEELRNMFEIDPGYYWRDHFRFDRVTQKKKRKMGRGTHELLVINTISPILYAYAKTRNNPKLRERAIEFLKLIGAENNFIIKKWETNGWKPSCSWESQAMIELRQAYCEKRHCTECRIGQWILN
jgi:hypothetical protein